MRDLGKVGVSLVGGGCRGLLQGGMYEAFLDMGIKYDFLYGVSVGALNGTIIHQGDFNKLKPLWMNIKNSDVYKFEPWNLYRLLNSNHGVYNSEPLTKLLAKYVDFNKLQQNKRQFTINCTDAVRKVNWPMKLQDFEDAQDYLTFLKASASPPIFFDFVNYRGTPTCDGGLVSNFNIHTAVKDGCDTVFLLYPTNEPPDKDGISNIKENLEFVISAPSFAFLDREIKSVEKINELITRVKIKCGPAQEDMRTIDLVLIIPKVPIKLGLLDFEYKNVPYTREEMWQIGYDSAKVILERI